MPKCVVFGCDRTTGKHLLEDDGCTPLNFFSLAGIPHNTLRTWLKLCKRSDIPFEKCKHARICSRHFMPCDILGNRMVKARLRIGAFPTRHLPFSKFATSFRETSQAQLSAVTKVKNIICEEKPEDFVLGTSQPPVFTHPILDVTTLEPPWYYNTVGDVTWYFLVTITDNSDNTFPEVEKSVRIANDGSRPQFYIGKEMLSEFRAKAVMRYKNFKIEDHFVRILEDFSKVPSTETSLLGTVLDMLNSVLDENENASATQEIVYEERVECDNNSEGAVDVQHVGHEESVTCDNSEENDSQVQDVEHKECESVESESNEVNTVGLRFMTEQLQLYAVPPRNRRWNSSLVRWAMAMHTSSPAAYRFMRGSGYLYLPCERTLSRYTAFGTLKPLAAKKRKGSKLIKKQNETNAIFEM